MRFILALLFLSSASLYADKDPLTVISYNIRLDAFGDWGKRDWDRRKNTVTDYLHNNNTGIIGLQEVLHKQLLDVEKALPDYAHLGVGREDGRTKGEYSPLFYHRATWTLDPKEHGTFWLSATPAIPNSRSWGNDFTRICTWARLLDKDGRALYVYNTHWDHRSSESREKSAELIMETIKKRTHPNEPFILMGDFNATTDDSEIRILLESGLLIDHGKVQVDSFNQWQAQLIPGLRIDHIFTSTSIDQATVVVEANGEPPGSDHHPILARLNW